MVSHSSIGQQVVVTNMQITNITLSSLSCTPELRNCSQDNVCYSFIQSGIKLRLECSSLLLHLKGILWIKCLVFYLLTKGHIVGWVILQSSLNSFMKYACMLKNNHMLPFLGWRFLPALNCFPAVIMVQYTLKRAMLMPVNTPTFWVITVLLCNFNLWRKYKTT